MQARLRATVSKSLGRPGCLATTFAANPGLTAVNCNAAGLNNDHVVHMVKAKPQPTPRCAPARCMAPAGAAALPAAPAPCRPLPPHGSHPALRCSPSSAAPASSPAAAALARQPDGGDPLVQQLSALGMGGPNPEAQADRMRSAMASPWFQAMASNPDFMRSMIQSNPALRQMTEANPQVGAMLNDPETMREMMRVMQNPVSRRDGFPTHPPLHASEL